MNYMMVIYFLINGVWVAGEDMPGGGWSAMAFPTLEKCQAAADRGTELYVDLKANDPRTHEKRFECEPREAGSDG